MHKLVDKIGQELEIGDYIIYDVTYADGFYMGTIVGFELNKVIYTPVEPNISQITKYMKNSTEVLNITEQIKFYKDKNPENWV
jgi:hypothetical protein